MGNIVLGRQVVETGPCSDPTYNFQSIAKVLEAMGNPSFDPGDGPEVITDGVPTNVDYDVVNPIYYDDGDIIRVDENGNYVVVLTAEGTQASVVRFYLKIRGKPGTVVTEANATFTITGITVLESIQVHVPYVEGTPATVPDITSGTITVQNDPPVRIAANGSVTVRYHHEDGKWYPDSLDNWEEHARARDTWDQTVTQSLGHTGTDSAIDWLSPTILVKVNGLGSKESTTAATEIKWNGSGWVDGSDVTVHNRSQTPIESEVEMTAVLVGDQYVLSWPDMAGLPGFDIESTVQQVPYRDPGDYDFKLAGKKCD